MSNSCKVKWVCEGKRWVPFALMAMLLAAFSGCKGTPTKGEKAARQELGTVSMTFRPEGKKPVLPELTTNSTLKDFLTYAMLNQPKVEAAYYDWAASVERITQARSGCAVE